MDKEIEAKPVSAAENENPSESPTEKSLETESPSQEGDAGAPKAAANTPDVSQTPFHKHPDWIRHQKELKELREFREKFKDFDPSSVQPKPQKEAEMPEWWKMAYGDDETSKKAFEKYMESSKSEQDGLYQSFKTRLKQEEEQAQKAQQDEVRKYEEMIETQLQALTDKGYVYDRNKILKIVKDYSSDSEGNFTGYMLPFERAYEILKLQEANKPDVTGAKKAIASHTTAGSNRGSKPETTNSIESVRKMDWGSWRK